MRGWFSSWRSHRALLRATRVGQRVQLRGPLAVEAFGDIIIGDDVRIGGASAMVHLVAARGATIEIGAQSVIGHGCGISATSSIVLGKSVHVGQFCLLLDSDFHQVGDHAATSDASPIHIDDNAFLEANVVVLRGARIGAGARVRAGSVVSGIVPAGAIVSGVPARIVNETPSLAPRPMHAGNVDGNDDIDTDINAEMRNANTNADVRALIANVFGLPSPPPNDALLESLAGWDSLGTLNLLLSLEERFDITIATEDFLRLRYVRDVADAVSASAHGQSTHPFGDHW